MVQPKTPPLSIRLGDVRLALVEAFAERRKLTRHAALLALIDAGLKSLGPSLPPPEERAAMKAYAIKRQAEPRRTIIAEMTYHQEGPPLPVSAVETVRLPPSTTGLRVPLHQPKAFNPQPKRGKK